MPGGSCEINRFGCRGDIQALKETGLPGKRQHSSDILRTACILSISSLNRHKYELAFYKATVFLFSIFMSYPGRHLHGCVCFCDAARFWDAQDGEVEERKRRAPDGFIRCSAPCSDWLMPTEVSRLNMCAAEGGLVLTRGLIWRLRF